MTAAAPTISAVVITCDDAEVLEPCLASLAPWVDEIVVLDMHSTDATRDIAQRYTGNVHMHDRLPYCEPARNAAIAHATSEWVLIVDPDERILPPLATELRRIAAEDGCDVVDIPRLQVAFGRVLMAPGTQDGAHPRFMRRSVASWPEEIHATPALEGLRRHDISALPDWRERELAMLHDTWRSPHQVLAKLARYVPLDAQRRLERGERFTFPGMTAAVLQQFRYRFVIGRAYEDGVAGFLHASLFAVQELGVYAEMWQQQGRPAAEDRGVVAWGRRMERSHRGLVTVWRPAKHAVRRTRGVLHGLRRR
jgi:glycosyltransferase involved in cell wall biosynthesis